MSLHDPNVPALSNSTAGDRSSSTQSTKKRPRNGGLPRYVYQRPESRVLQFRMAVPKCYRGVAGRSLIVESLGTRDIREAALRAGKRRAELIEQWRATATSSAALAQASVRRFASSEVIAEIALDVADLLVAQLRIKAAEKLHRQEQFQDFVASCRRYAMFYANKAELGHFDGWKALIERKLGERGLALPDNPDQAHRSLHAAGLVIADAFRRAADMAEGNLAVEPAPMIRELKARLVSRSAPKGETMLELFARYAEEKRLERKGFVSIEEKRRVVTWLAEFVGKGRRVGSITRVEAADFRTALTDLPSGFSKQKCFENKSLAEARALAKELKLPRRSLRTINKELSYVSAFFEWLQKQGRCEANPFSNLLFTVSPEVREEKRLPPFSTDQLNKILTSPLFTGFKGPRREHLPGEMLANDWRIWIPLVCLFTGARISEPAQLFTDDVIQAGDVWLIHFQPDSARSQRLKTPPSRRIVPVHSKLVQLGFVHYVRWRQAAAGGEPTRLFPEIKPDKRDGFGQQPSKFFRRYLTRIGLKQGKDGFGSHSFRHGMSDALRDAGFYDAEFGAPILGHSHRTITSGYGQKQQGTIEQRRRMIEAIDLSELDFSKIRVAPLP